MLERTRLQAAAYGNQTLAPEAERAYPGGTPEQEGGGMSMGGSSSSSSYGSGSWKGRAVGMTAAMALNLGLLGGALFTFSHSVNSVKPPPAPMQVVMIDEKPVESPQEAQHDVPDGQLQVEMQKLPPLKRVDPPDLKIQQVDAKTDRPKPPPEPQQQSAPDTVPQTTAPKVIEAPHADQVAGTTATDWQSKVLVHLEKFRRYPPAARTRREQGVVLVSFRTDRHGMVSELRVIESSGSPVLDGEARETVLRARPLPAPPDDVPGDSFQFSVPVIFSMQ